MEYEIYHWGVKGMKWGVRKERKSNIGYKSTGIRSALSRRSNEKVDKGFKDWKDNAKKRDDAIELGKQANLAKQAYENDRANKALKSAYKDANAKYKKALSENTTYRKGVVRQEVGRDAARKYLSEAKKVKKQLVNDPTNKTLQKKYNELMSQHDIERAKARRAVEVSTKRSQIKANAKRTMTKTVKAVAVTAAVAGGAYAINRYLSNHDVTINGKSVRLGAKNVQDVAEVAKKAKNIMGLMW